VPECAWIQSNGYNNCGNRQCTFYRGCIEGRVYSHIIALVFLSEVDLDVFFRTNACKAVLINVCWTFTEDQKHTVQKHLWKPNPGSKGCSDQLSYVMAEL